MARFDVYSNPDARSETTPYLLDVQSDLLDMLDSRMVIPLRRLGYYPQQIKMPERLIPMFRVGGTDCLLDTPQMAAVPRRILSVPVGSLAAEQDRIVAALDFLFQGY